MSKTDHNYDDQLEDLQDWSENQYNPGHWTGGNIPPHIKRGNIGKVYGFFFMILGIFVALSGLGMLIFDYPNNAGQKIIVIVVGLILSTAGYKRIKP